MNVWSGVLSTTNHKAPLLFVRKQSVAPLIWMY